MCFMILFLKGYVYISKLQIGMYMSRESFFTREKYEKYDYTAWKNTHLKKTGWPWRSSPEICDMEKVSFTSWCRIAENLMKTLWNTIKMR